jgi:hypothetical protein
MNAARAHLFAPTVLTVYAANTLSVLTVLLAIDRLNPSLGHLALPLRSRQLLAL